MEMLSAAALVKYWDLEAAWPPIIFYFLVPFFLVGLNLFPVYVYGWIETVGGALKTLLIIVVSCILFGISRQGKCLSISVHISWQPISRNDNISR
jgi:amino acid permease